MTAPITMETKTKIKKVTPEKLNAIIPAGSTIETIKFLDLSERGINSIISLDGLKSLRKLDVSSNLLTRLSGFRSIKQITWLNAMNNNITGDGFSEIKHLVNLVTLNLANNNIHRCSPEYLRHLRQLKALVLNNNRIGTIEWIPRLPELNTLILSHNRLTSLPASIASKFPNVYKLSLSSNLLDEMPDFSEMTSLQELRLSHNKISNISLNLEKNELLRVVDLGHNLIDNWESIEALAKLKNLKQLNLKGNPICGKCQMNDKQDLIKEDLNKEDLNKEDLNKEDLNKEDKKKEKKAEKALDAKHKQYNFRMKRIFPDLVIRDGQRLVNKKIHGYEKIPTRNIKENSIENKKISKEKRKFDSIQEKQKKKKKRLDTENLKESIEENEIIKEKVTGIEKEKETGIEKEKERKKKKEKKKEKKIAKDIESVEVSISKAKEQKYKEEKNEEFSIEKDNKKKSTIKQSLKDNKKKSKKTKNISGAVEVFHLKKSINRKELDLTLLTNEERLDTWD